MKKKIAIFIAIIMLGIMSVAAFLYYRHCENEYYVVMLENIIKDNIISSTTYKRIKSNVSIFPDKAFVQIKFAAQNASGSMLDSEAAMVLVPNWPFYESRVSYLDEYELDRIAQEKKENRNKLRTSNYVISTLIVANKVFDIEEVEVLSSNLMDDRGSYPFFPPAPSMNSYNRYKTDREIYKKKWEKDAEARAALAKAEREAAIKEEIQGLLVFIEKINSDGEMNASYTVNTDSSGGTAVTVFLTPIDEKKYWKIGTNLDMKTHVLSAYACPEEGDAFWDSGFPPESIHAYLNKISLGNCSRVRK